LTFTTPALFATGEFVTCTGRTNTSPGTNRSKLNAVNGAAFNATEAVMKLF